MKIEALETIKHHPIYMELGDIKTVDEVDGQYCVDHGWARNVETDKVGEREGGPISLAIDSSNHSTKSEVK